MSRFAQILLGQFTVLVLQTLAGAGGDCPAATVAYWRFEPSNLTADSAGSNGLSNTGVTSSLDVASDAPGTGSASFNGSQTLFQTTGMLNLTPYTDLTIEWFMKTSQSTIATLWEHNNGNNPGALAGFINDLLPNGAEFFQRGTAGTYIDEAPRPLDGQWHHYAAILDGSATGAARLTLYIDSVDVGTFNGSFSPPSGTPALQNATWRIGQRNGTQFQFNGLLDELRISDSILSVDQFLNAPLPAPEPSSMLLLAFGSAICARSARHRVTRRSLWAY